MKLCDTCIYRNNVEQLKPCIIYRDDCKLYEKGNMTNDDAVNIIKMGLDNNSIDCFDIKQYMAIDMAIKALEQEPKTGHWIERNDDHYDWYECSECGYGAEGEITMEGGVRFNYCPNCGADMRGDTE